jgi:hypothetical protein
MYKDWIDGGKKGPPPQRRDLPPIHVDGVYMFVLEMVLDKPYRTRVCVARKRGGGVCSSWEINASTNWKKDVREGLILPDLSRYD